MSLAKQKFIDAKTISPTVSRSWVRQLFEQHCDSNKLDSYRLPCSPDTHVVVGLSGGADSSVLALLVWAYLTPIYPNIHLVFCDTEAEPSSAYAALDQIELMTGMHIDRIKNAHGLFELIEKNGGFLPSPKSRYCTAF